MILVVAVLVPLVLGTDLVGWSPFMAAAAAVLTAGYAVFNQQKAAHQARDAKEKAGDAAARTVGLQELEAAVEAQGQTIRTLRQQSDSDRREMREMRSQLASAYSELATLRAQVERCGAEKRSLRLDYEKTAAELHQEITGLQAQVAELSRRNGGG